MSIDTEPSQPRRVRETYAAGVRALVHAGWAEELPWLVQGTTTRGTPGRELDLGLFSGGSPETVVRDNWGQLLALTAMTSAVHARQVHGAEVRFHESTRSGLRLVEECDGHATDLAGILLTVSVADCVPVFVVAPEARAVAVLHAGWRGVVAGVLERGLNVLADRLGTHVSELLVHLGPAICGACYEVGPEVHAALGAPLVRGSRTIDLRGVLAARAAAIGVETSRLTTSAHCTRCTESGLFSHRAGDLGRQVGYIGVRPSVEGDELERPRPGPDHAAGYHRVGLCASCRHHRVVVSGRGSTFHLCERSKSDPRYHRYPTLPVRVCEGWDRSDAPRT